MSASIAQAPTHSRSDATPDGDAAPPRLRVLLHEFLSAGAVLTGLDPATTADLLAQGSAMRNAVARDLLAVPGVQVVCVDSAASPAPAGCTSRRATDPDEPAAALLARLARECAVDAVCSIAPETDGLLLAISQAIPPALWLGSTPSAIELTSSKSATRRVLAAAGIDVPLGAQADDPTPGWELAEQAWIVKPDIGAGATATDCHANWASASRAARTRQAAGETVALETWIDGDALSLSLLCSDAGVELLSINRQHIRLEPAPWNQPRAIHFDGVEADVEATSTSLGQALTRLAGHIAAAIPGLRGFVGIDLVWHPRRGPVVIEVNPRLTSAYVGLSERLQRPLGASLIAAGRASRRKVV